ncbi:MAG: hypothetical protein PHQ23_14905 [Candidatus Wallbacteria bacterium]|nr:hypothetical protein [Candidatus Wallbacteria bacterium]
MKSILIVLLVVCFMLPVEAGEKVSSTMLGVISISHGMSQSQVDTLLQQQHYSAMVLRDDLWLVRDYRGLYLGDVVFSGPEKVVTGITRRWSSTKSSHSAELMKEMYFLISEFQSSGYRVKDCRNYEEIGESGVSRKLIFVFARGSLQKRMVLSLQEGGFGKDSSLWLTEETGDQD